MFPIHTLIGEAQEVVQPERTGILKSLFDFH